MKNLILGVLLLLTTQTNFGQVETKFFPNKDALSKIEKIKQHPKAQKTMKMPSFNKEALLEEDSKNNGKDVPFRFGKGFDVNVNLSDGMWAEVDSGRLWSMEFESSGAYSINFVFNDFHLSDGAYLYITNEENTTLYGPVTSKENTKDGYFLTDLIKGDKVTVYLFEPKDKKGLSRITIKRIIHAYKNLFIEKSFGSYGASGSCNNDVVCFAEWSAESDAVALVLLSDGTELCSGSLLMTANYSFRPYFLSAFHCIDASQNGVLSDTEISDAQRWLLKFQYKKNDCNGNAATTGITYNSATFRAAWNDSDFALLEMNSSPVGDSRFSWLGWDRTGNNPTSGTGIHHPAGDVMKISFDNNAITSNTNILNWPGGVTSPVNSHWTVNWDSGVTEGGSSGSPLFNQDKRVVGQLHGGNSSCTSSDLRDWYGRFNISWTGGGTNTTRLSNWLDPTNTGVMIMNSARYPSISGPSSVCISGTYCIDYLPPGATVQWSIPYSGAPYPQLFQNVPEANQATITNPNFYPINMTLTANVYMGTNLITTLTKQVAAQSNSSTQYGSYYQQGCIVNDVALRTLSGSINGNYFYLNQGCLAEITLYDMADKSVSFYSGYPPSYWSYNATNSKLLVRPAVGSSGVPTTFKITGGCTDKSVQFFTYSLNEGRLSAAFELSPNPASSTVNIEIAEETPLDNSAAIISPDMKATSINYTIQLWNSFGLVKQVEANQKNYQLELYGVPPGFYYVHVIKDGQTYRSQLVVK